ncbi:uncharacterized protein LOC132794261 [Drosophila nasuta]|uniref:Uncharacterized protein LOC117570858 n=1 Tax=Drosophila albomicans TaxID=7291 RepID=A0A6P8X6M0_DROAB|nr:uncharacterized protein LOC117570858 [Drosophila albomicans]XP_060660555.1 uncharacterized protein LOC132794261 [Drosophila nasuta]
MIFYVLQTISTTLITALSTIWLVEETMINLMMSCSLMALRFACHPMMLLPMLLGTYYVIRKVWQRRRVTVEGSADGTGLRNLPRTPRIGPYRSVGSISSRSNESYECEVSEEETRRCS